MPFVPHLNDARLKIPALAGGIQRRKASQQLGWPHAQRVRRNLESSIMTGPEKRGTSVPGQGEG